ncbi:MAG TPA: type II toxin-antitoxin system mRNA interferase toxin, RelE/StbE family [Deltaproteobacteria bacterium]|jgi:addiction module RelE/StbE family toxin|nr:type II toxin-antitoxin system mRNA interferase toxin, RelE/StbE family [Deltaproteobacteria bacterium]
MRLEWTLKAFGDLRQAGEYIATDNPEAAKRMAARIKEAVEYLIDHPNMGRPGRLVNTRELVVSGTPFIVVYWVKGAAIQILRVLHHAKRWP